MEMHTTENQTSTQFAILTRSTPKAAEGANPGYCGSGPSLIPRPRATHERIFPLQPLPLTQVQTHKVWRFHTIQVS